MIRTFRKFGKKINFNQKIYKTGVYIRSINYKNYAAAYYQII